MKTISIGLLGLFSCLLLSCVKEDSEEAALTGTQQKILGKWMLVKHVEEIYQPVNSLVSKDETIGLPGDSIIFRSNNILNTYSDIDGRSTEDYEVINGNTVRIEFEEWHISQLTATEMILVSEETNSVENRRDVATAVLRR